MSIQIEEFKVHVIERDEEHSKTLLDKYKSVSIACGKTKPDNAISIIALIDENGLYPKGYTEDQEFAEYIALMHTILSENYLYNTIKMASSFATICCLFNNLFECFKNRNAPYNHTYNLLESIKQEISELSPLIQGKMKELYDELDKEIKKDYNRKNFEKIMSDNLKAALEKPFGKPDSTEKEH